MTQTLGKCFDKAYKSSYANTSVKSTTDQTNDEINDLAGKIKKANDGYEQFAGQLPIYAGTFIFMGIDKKNKEIPIKIYTWTNSRADFKANVVINNQTGESITRREWLNNKINQYNLKTIIIYPARPKQI